jgi:hypothetical protein
MIIQIVPNLPPVICGVGDYAALVGAESAQVRPSLHSAFVACGWRAEVQPEETVGLRNITGACDGAELWRAIEALVDERRCDADAPALVVQYSGYGYDPSGAPAWLADALERRPRRFAAAKIVTMFHELYASGPIWRRAFWWSTRQRHVTTRLARISDELMTNRLASARWLERASGRPAASVAHLPVVSNVGEPATIEPWARREPVAVAFGAARFKRPFFQGRGARQTVELCRKLEIETIFSIGPHAAWDEAAFRRAGVRVIEMGYLSASDVSTKMSAARVALVDYFPGYYAKSSVLAAAAANGTPPIFPRPGQASDGLCFGENIWSLRSAQEAGETELPMRLAALSGSIRSWYDGHNLRRHADLVGELIVGRAPVAA